MHRLPTIAQASVSIRDGQLRPVDLVEHCLQRIETLDHQLQAWVLVDQAGARSEAERLGQLVAENCWLGPLHGIPIGVKDIIDVAGMPTEAGSPLLKGQIAQQDAPVVAQLRRCGAILLGKTVTTEFGCFDPSPTRNPWTPSHTPGGSSSGSAAAVASDMCMAALGTQTGGSITRPASYCGVCGLKPTYGRTDLAGVVPISGRLDHLGVIARTVGDMADVFRGMISSGQSLPASADASPAPCLYAVDEFFLERADDSVRDATRSAYDRLQEAGAEFRRLPLPPTFGQVPIMHHCIMAVEAAELHVDTFSQHMDQYGPKLRDLIEQGLSTFAIDYSLALRHWELFRKDMRALFADGRIAVAPATLTAAPASLETTGDPALNSPWSYAGLPVVNIPCGLTREGLPCGLQLVGAPNEEERLLSAAAWCEQVLRFDPTPPVLRP